MKDKRVVVYHSDGSQLIVPYHCLEMLYMQIHSYIPETVKKTGVKYHPWRHEKASCSDSLMVEVPCFVTLSNQPAPVCRLVHRVLLFASHVTTPTGQNLGQMYTSSMNDEVPLHTNFVVHLLYDKIYSLNLNEFWWNWYCWYSEQAKYKLAILKRLICITNFCVLPATVYRIK